MTFKFNKTLREIFKNSENKTYLDFKEKVFRKYLLVKNRDYIDKTININEKVKYSNGKITIRPRKLKEIFLSDDTYKKLINDKKIVKKSNWNKPEQYLKERREREERVNRETRERRKEKRVRVWQNFSSPREILDFYDAQEKFYLSESSRELFKRK